MFYNLGACNNLGACTGQFLYYFNTESVSDECYNYTEEDRGHLIIDDEPAVCEAHSGYIFTHGNDRLAPGCGGCWCCKPRAV